MSEINHSSSVSSSEASHSTSDAPRCERSSVALWDRAAVDARFAQLEGQQISLAVLGSTGSIGRSCLEIVRRFPERFRVAALAAGGGQLDLLAAQVREFCPDAVAVADPLRLEQFRVLLSESAGAPRSLEILSGVEGVVQTAQLGAVVLAGISGVAGLRSTIAALERGAIVALANKESIVCGGELLRKAMVTQNSSSARGVIIPVDSEHSSLAQLLGAAPRVSEIESLILTASGGPFLQTPLAELGRVTPAQAIKHPRWSMGAKISIDSATLANKALEWFETIYLFGCENVEVVIHPESIIHALVRLRDGAVLANLSYPDMKLPIGYAIGLTERLPRLLGSLDLVKLSSLHFQAVEHARFPILSLAQQAYRNLGAFGSCLFSLANEEAVARFTAGVLSFGEISPFVARALERIPPSKITDATDISQLHARVRALA